MKKRQRCLIALALSLLFLPVACDCDHKTTVVTGTATLSSTAVVTGTLCPTKVEPCATAEGRVEGYWGAPKRENCPPESPPFHASLYRGDRLLTVEQEQLDFSTDHIKYCIMLANALDVVFPQPDIYLCHEKGKTYCDVKSQDETRIRSPGADIVTTNAIFGVEVSAGGTSVQVASGTVTLRSVADPTVSVSVNEGQQLFVPADEPLQAFHQQNIKVFTPNHLEQEIITSLELDVVTMPLDQVGELISRQGAGATAVIAENQELLKGVLPRLPRLEQTRLRTYEFRDLDIGSGVRTVVVTGSFDASAQVFTDLRERFGPDIEILYVPP